MIKLLRKILLLALILSSNTYSSEHFVTNNLELINAIAKAKPGDIVIMKNGIWSNTSINFQNNGVSGNPIILKAEKPGQVILSGKSNLRIAGNFLVVDGLVFENGYSSSGQAVVEFRSSSGVESNYCRLTNTSIIDYNPTDSKTDYKWVSLYGTYNRIDHCYLRGKNHLGTTLVVWLSNKPNYHLIDSNYFAFRPEFPENGAETIRVGTSDWSLYDSFTTVEYNYFEECNGETEIISSKSCGNIYRYNTFKDCKGTLTLRHGNRCTVEGNYFFCGKKENSGGIRIIGEDHKVINNYIEDSYGSSFKSGITIMNGVPNSPLNRYFQVKRAIVANNTVVNSRFSILIGAGKNSELSLPPLDCILANNIFYSTTSPLVSFEDIPINMLWSGNLFFGASIGMTLPAENYNFNPLLVKGNDNLFRLSKNSPAIDKANPSLIYSTQDFDGQKRSISDIGADEFSAEPITIKPVGPKDTGPKYLQITSIERESNVIIPSNFVLHQNYPNPFNPTTTISFTMPVSGKVLLEVYDLTGKNVDTLIDKEVSAGKHSVELNSIGLSSGIYFYRIIAKEFIATRKFVLMK